MNKSVSFAFEITIAALATAQQQQGCSSAVEARSRDCVREVGQRQIAAMSRAQDRREWQVKKRNKRTFIYRINL